jgi:signal transduction histidine kinase
MNEGLVLLAPDGSPQFATTRTYELFGCATLDDLRRRWTDLGEPARTALEHLAESGVTPPPIHVEVATAGGPRRLRLDIERARAASAEGAARTAGYAAIVRDRDLADAVETDLRLATHLRALSRLSGAIAHDMKAPLAAVLLHLELLRGTLDDDREGQAPRERRLRYVGVMKDELGRLNRALTSLFTQTALRSEAWETFDLRDLVHELEFLIRPQAQRQGIALELSPGDGVATMRGHRDAIKHAMLNVAVNALEAMPDGGRLQITLEPKDDALALSMRDTGSGIPDDVLPRIFDLRFTTKPAGCGMGLYVTRSVLELHGGAIRTEPATEGACFRLDLPKAAEA